jgi:hypothetical protein
MPEESQRRHPLANRVAEHINVAGRGSDFYLTDMATGRARSPGRLHPDEQAQLLRAMVVALIASVQEIAADVDELFDRLDRPH